MAEFRHDIKDSDLEKHIFQFRARLALVLVVFMILGLFARMIWLQVWQYDAHAARSERNRIHVEAVPPTRGLIYDREGRLLAENLPSHSLTIVRERAGNLDLVLRRICDLLEMGPGCVDEMHQRAMTRRRPFEPALLVDQLTDDQMAKLSVNRYLLPGVEIEAQLRRYYPMGADLTHVLGYVGRINEKELKRLDPTQYSGTHYVGKSGVERFYEDQLHGQVGYRKVETNARGRVLRVLERQPPQPGNDIVLQIDARLQKEANKALGDYRGAVVAIEPKTGGILAMASMPSFDPNLFVSGIDRKTYQALRRDPDLPLFNRVTHGRYPPGSTVKPFLALAGLETGSVTLDTVVNDPGYYQLPNDSRRYRNWKRWGHGRVDLHRAIEVSNDTYFYHMAYVMGIDDLSQTMQRFGFGSDTSLDVEGARPGLMPSRAWKRRAHNQPWYPGETLSVGIGQGYWLSTPLQLATATAVLAEHGRWVQPRLAKSINGKELPLITPDTPPDIQLHNPEYWDFVVNALVDVMSGPEGTGRRAGRGLTYKMAGKSGTAQVFSLAKDQEYDADKLPEHLHDHALFISFAPADDPQIAISVLAENGGGGSGVAGPIARHLSDFYLLPRLKAQQAEKEGSTDGETP